MFEQQVVPQLHELVPYQPGKPIEELQRELGLRDIIKLASNENPLGCSPRAIEAMQQAMPELARYPDGNAYYLKEKLAEFHGVEPEQILPGNGSNEVLELVVRTFAGPGDEVIYDEHAFAVYPLSTRAAGATGIAVPSREFAHDLDAMAAAINTRTKLIFLANPNNPTGTLFDAGAFEAFMQQVPLQVLVVLDEAYYEYAHSFEGYPDGLDYLHQYPNLVISRTFSKAYGLAGIRLGYLIAHTEIISYINRVREPFNVNLLAQAAGMAALEDQDFVAEGVALNQRNLAAFEQFLQAHDLRYIPSHGNFVSVQFKDAAAVNAALLHRGVIVRPLLGYGMGDWLRISIGTDEEMARCMQHLEEVLHV